MIMNNSIWLIGNGEKINFWQDVWWDNPLIQSLNVPSSYLEAFPSSLSSYISNHHWNIPTEITDMYPHIRRLAEQVILPSHFKADCLLWKHNSSGSLSLKDAYEFKRHHFPKIDWTKHIWSIDIPPSKSMMVWRFMLDKLPTDDQLVMRGCHFPSMCSLCSNSEETSFHLFFQCPYVVQLWRWLASTLDCTLHFQTKEEVWSICNKGWNPQCKSVVTSALINIYWSIWFARNNARFNNKKIHWKSSISSILSAASLTGNLTNKKGHTDMRNFTVLKKFGVCIHPPNAPKIIEVVWYPPIFSWVKCNTDGSSTSINSACGGIFRDNHAKFLLCFAEKTGSGNAYQAEISGAMRAIELAAQYQWRNLWLECDSAMVVNAFSNHNIIPWKLRNRWENCLNQVSKMNFLVTHVYREGNCCADALANEGLTLDVFTVWLEIPAFIRGNFVRDRLGMPNYRFINP